MGTRVKAPKPKEVLTRWLGVSDTVRDALTFDIWHVKTGKVIQKRVVQTADPNKSVIPNLQIHFDQELEGTKEPKKVKPVNILDDQELMCQTRTSSRPPRAHGERTRKYKVK